MQLLHQFYIRSWFGSVLKRRFSEKITPVTHVIFDLDGTILDTEKIYTHIYTKLLQKYGKKYNEEVRLAVTGINKVDGCRIIVEKLQLPTTVDEFYVQVQEKRYTDLTHPELKPGAERLIHHLSDNKVPIAIATSSSEESYNIKTSKYLRLFSLFHHVVNGSSDPEVRKGKPAPDIFLVAARRFIMEPSPKMCLVFEDSPNGVVGARAAGMKVVMTPDETCPVEMTKDATLVIKSLEVFIPEDFGLPRYH